MKNLVHSIKLLMLVSVIGMLVACGSKLTPANLDKVQNEMTTAQVESILGKPTEIKTSGFMGFTATTYVYKKGRTEVDISFVNDKVMTKSGSFEN
jgi:hypothetical protein